MKIKRLMALLVAMSQIKVWRTTPTRPFPEERNLRQKILHLLRRSHSRVEAFVNVYLFWRSDGREDVAMVKNLSFSGLFIETEKSKDPGDTVELYFLVQEGQIRADAVVRRAKPGHGLGLRLMAVHNNDRRRLAELMKRLRRGARDAEGSIPLRNIA
jgi:hypothetical protein